MPQFCRDRREQQAMERARDTRFREALIATQSLEVKDMEPDGNCLFRAFAHQVWGDQDRHAAMRKQCCEYMVEHSEDYSVMFPSPAEFEE